MILKNFCGHLKTIVAHKHKVFVHCCKAGIIWRGLMHDLSKFSPSEFIPGVKYFTGDRSPNEKERENIGYSKAWMHHKGRNKHHFDRVAAAKIYHKNKYDNSMPLEYFLRAKHRRTIDSETSDKLEFLLNMLVEKGERDTFKYIRNKVKKNA